MTSPFLRELQDRALLLSDENVDDGIGFFPTDLINADPPRTRKDRLSDAVMEFVKEDDNQIASLSKKSHVADLEWISKELRGTLMSHGDSEYNHAMVLGRVQLLASAVDKRIGEIE